MNRPAQGAPPAPSFVYEVTMQSRRAHVRRDTTAWILDDKLAAYRFAAAIGLRVPAVSPRPLAHTELALSPGTVAKPLEGLMSQGVFIIGRDSIFDLERNEYLASVEEVRARVAASVATGRIATDAWIEEELVTSDVDPSSPARDIKFYSFYGQVGLALETVRGDGVRRCWYNAKGEVVTTGKYTRELFAGHGIPDGLIELAAETSLAVPAPFLRIDFLASPTGPVLNEFTPKPGGASQFNASTDRRLGSMLVAAAGRLHADLLGGRDFPAFKKVRAELSERR
ncbi:ATP-grasp fold amidoligase family protein [Zafaria sp. Z1313]|uniref:ATP-grasp fold amidoligase family protein n=1 Tax=Zafaria sp. Z1313 TaxID=3423202 RepID=UPI003D302937